jgi:hypothetical protein
MVTIKLPAVVVNIAVSLIATLAVLLLFEIGGWAWLNYLADADDYRQYALYTQINPSAFKWTGHHYLNYYPSPHYNDEGTSHNSLGYRNDEFPVEKPAGVYRIVALGGSTTYTEKVKDNAKTFTAQLENVLRGQYGYQGVQVINAGVPGYNTWESLINLEFRVLDLNPDLVIIYHNTNDVHARLVAPEAYRGDDSGARKQWREPPVKWWEHSAILRILSRKLDWTEQVRLDDFVDAPTTLENGGGDPYTMLQQNQPIYFKRNLANMIAVARENKVKVLLSTWAYSPHFGDYASKDYYQQAYGEQNEIIRGFAGTHYVPVFDLAAEMPQAEEYWADGRHVNEAGALMKAQLFAQFIDDAGLIPR